MQRLPKYYKMNATFGTHTGGSALTHTLKHPSLKGAELHHSVRVPTKVHTGTAVGVAAGAAGAYGGYKAYRHFKPKGTTTSPKPMGRVRRKR